MLDLLDRWDIDSLATRIVQRDLSLAFHEWEDDPGFSEMLAKSVYGNLEVLSQYLAGAIALDDVVLGDQVAFAQEQAQVGSSQNALQRSYRLGMHTIASDWLALVSDEGRARGLSADDVGAAMIDSVDKILRYADLALTKVADEFAQQEARLRRSGQQIRQQVLWEIVTGSGPVETGEMLMTLGYDLTGAHMAVEVVGIPSTHAHKTVKELRKAGNSSHHLMVNRRVDRLTVWLYQPRQWTGERLDALRQFLRSTGYSAALSRPAVGVEGIRETFREITEMEVLGPLTGSAAPHVISYDEVQLELLLLKDADAARRFVSDTLGELAEDNPASVRLRETLLASFSCGSHVQAAEMLGLHEHTVRNRLQRAEQVLGEAGSQRRVEIQTALRLHATLSR